MTTMEKALWSFFFRCKSSRSIRHIFDWRTPCELIEGSSQFAHAKYRCVQELLRHCEDDDDAYDSVKRALATMTSVVKYVNDAMHQNSIKGFNVRTYPLLLEIVSLHGQQFLGVNLHGELGWNRDW